MTKEQLLEKWQQFVESQVWQGEDDFTKNMAVGNAAEWWISEFDRILSELQKEVSMKTKMKEGMTETYEANKERQGYNRGIKDVISLIQSYKQNP